LIEAVYYDGKSARRHTVTLQTDRHMLLVRGEGIAREASLPQITIHTRLGNTPRVLEFPDGAHCEVTDHAALDILLESLGHRSSPLARLESCWRYALASLLVTLGFVAASYVWGLPWLAEKVALRIPTSVQAEMDQQLLLAFDESRLMQASTLSVQRQSAIANRFLALRLPQGAEAPKRILFRNSPRIGPNAFALPGGTVVVLDQLVALSGNDEEILAVMAHEMGHVSERHVLRQMLQASVVGLVATWYVGDISQLLAIAPATLLETRYSRDFERRADAYAARVLVMNGIPPSRLADMLERLERKLGGHKEQGISAYMASHPATDERIKALRGQR
jgi:Zn-dependent protease with chaperone function